MTSIRPANPSASRSPSSTGPAAADDTQRKPAASAGTPQSSAPGTGGDKAATGSGKLGEQLASADAYTTSTDKAPDPRLPARASGTTKLDKDAFLRKKDRIPSGSKSPANGPGHPSGSSPGDSGDPPPSLSPQSPSKSPWVLPDKPPKSKPLVELDKLLKSPPPETPKPVPAPASPAASPSPSGSSSTKPAVTSAAGSKAPSASAGTDAHTEAAGLTPVDVPPTSAAAPSGAKGSSAAADPKPAPADQEGLGSFAEGLFLGDFSKNDSWSALAGQVLGGLNPIADARDVAAAALGVVKGEDGAWANLGLNLVTSLPIPGIDLLKRGVKAAARTAAEGIGDAVISGAKRLAAGLSDNFGGMAAGVVPWHHIRAWHDKRATQIFGPGKGLDIGNKRHYDKLYKGRDIEFKSDNFAKAPRTPKELATMEKQIDKDITFKKSGESNPHWHFNHDPTVAPEMAPLLKKLEDAGIPWSHGSKPGF